MCGIAAIMFKRGPANVGEAMVRMLVSLQHRGPDSTGYALYGSRGGGVRTYVVWVKLEEPDAVGAERARALAVQTDEMLDAKRRAEVFGFIKGMEIPGRYKSALFRRWGEMVEAPATDVELRALRGLFKVEE